MTDNERYAKRDHTVWYENAEMEHALYLKANSRAEYAALSPDTKMSVDYYIIAKQQAAEATA